MSQKMYKQRLTIGDICFFAQGDWSLFESDREAVEMALIHTVRALEEFGAAVSKIENGIIEMYVPGSRRDFHPLLKQAARRGYCEAACRLFAGYSM